jgi:DNA-directed RNA polymerase subunit RPC12/RpoP
VKTLLGLWVAAAICIFIPLAHFVLVPGLTVAGLVFGFWRFRGVVTLDPTPFPCPKCGKPVPIEEDTAGWPAKAMCPECSSRLVMTPTAAPSS